MRIHRNLIIVACLVLGSATPPLQAATISVSSSSINVTPNGLAELAVMVAGAGEAINLTGYEFRITPLGGATSQLQFAEESEAFLSDGGYLFAGNSAAANDGALSSIGTVSTSVLPGDTFIGGDSTNDLSDVAISGSKLLVKLLVTHSAGPADPLTTVGDQFSISLVPSTGDSNAFAAGASNTGFLDSSLAGFPYASQNATVTVVIPEPQAALLLPSLVAYFFHRRRQCEI